ncbi:hypothetical protein MMC10_006750 [Thelotrema lepadinum]|nr:hypothetical protein [Thelotrema lepadinum]
MEYDFQRNELSKAKRLEAELAAMPRTWQKFDGNFNSTSKFKADEPSNSIDWEWLRFSVNHLIDGTAAIVQATDEDIRRSWKDNEWMNTTVKLDEEYGGGYMATLEMFHQLHCLNMVRMGLRPERYSFALHYNVSEGTLSKHYDHCIDILRQVIMCNGDTSLLTFHWVEGNPFPYPDFNTWHQCRDPEQILEWALRRQPDMKALVEKKPTDVEMPVAP